MTDAIKDFVTSAFGNCPWLGIVLIAMIPIVELRGAIPFAMSSAFWGTAVLPWWQAYLFAVLGSSIPALLIVPLLKPLFAWMKKTKCFKSFANALEKRFKRKSSSISDDIKTGTQDKKAFRIKFFGVLSFVAVPLPLTGAWTGSAVAAYLNIKVWWGILAVVLGNLISGAIMTAICCLFPGAEKYILYAFLGLAVLLILGSILYGLLKKNKNVEKIDSDNLEDINDNK